MTDPRGEAEQIDSLAEFLTAPTISVQFDDGKGRALYPEEQATICMALRAFARSASAPSATANARAVAEWHDRLGAMLDHAGHPDYSLREMFAGLRQLRDDMIAAAPSPDGNDNETGGAR